MTAPLPSRIPRRHRTIAICSAAVAIGMIGAAYAAVPLYRIFCQATGYDGTPRRAERAPDKDKVLERTVTVRFDGNVSPDLPWTFAPEQTTMKVKVGESVTAYYRATNTSDHRVVASATYNIAPDYVASYFNKIQCFCFTEQTLEAGQSADMAVNFFIDPEVMNDRDARTVTEVTVSYTFFPVKSPGVAQKQTGSSG
jgi:cytochrome c oxidase assembly protein subunit 11